MNEPNRTELEKRAITPLWVISLFVSLSETVLGIAVTQTSGNIQAALTAFVIGFPLLIAGAFFVILWNRPEVLYAPTEYGKETDVTSFAKAMRRKPLEEQRLYLEIQGVLKETTDQIKATLSEAVGKRDDDELVSRILDTAASQAVEKIREVGFLTLDSRPLLGREGKVWQVPYDQYGSVSALLDDIWFSIGTLPAFTYNKKWILRDPTSSLVFDKMGTKWAEDRGWTTDARRLEEVGIRPGMILEITPLDRKGSNIQRGI